MILLIADRLLVQVSSFMKTFWFVWWQSYWIWYAGMWVLHVWRKCSQNKVTVFLHSRPSEGAGKTSAEVGSSEWQCCLAFSHQSCSPSCCSPLGSDCSGQGGWTRWPTDGRPFQPLPFCDSVLLASGCCEDLWGGPWGTFLSAVAFALWTVPTVWTQGFTVLLSELVWLKRSDLTVLAGLLCGTT